MKVKETTGICVPFKDAEKIQKYLSEKKLLRTDLLLSKDKDYICFPIKKVPKELTSYKIIRKSFEKKETKPTSYKEMTSIPKRLKHELPTSYDIIGDIILIKLTKKLLKYKKEIGESLLKSNKNIKAVCLTEPISGEFRTRNIKVISGEERTTTTHTEYGLTFKVNVENTYFSPRLATERKRVASLVKQGEIVVDMFAGVAPFSIMIAKYANPKIIYSIDKNLEAVKYAQENVRRNNVLDKIEVLHADAKEVPDILNKKDAKADRIIMNLPFSAHLFFAYSLEISKEDCVIHYYDILREEKIDERIDELKKIAEKNKTILTSLDVRKIKTYAPREFYIGIDITARKKPM